MKRDTIAESDLHAFIDGELDKGRSDAVRAYLETHPHDAARVDAWRRQNAAIRRAFEAPRDPVSVQRPSRAVDDAIPAPASIDAPRLDLIRAARRRRRAVATLAAFLGGACVTLLGAMAFSRVGSAPDPATIGEPVPLAPAAQARRARLAWRTYARQVDRSFDAPAGDRSSVSAGLQRATALPRIPDLSPEKFDLLTTRIMPGESEPAAFLLYESPARLHVALIVERTPDADGGPLLSDDGGLRCLSWRAAGYAFALVGPADPDTLRALARATGTTFAGR